MKKILFGVCLSVLALSPVFLSAQDVKEVEITTNDKGKDKLEKKETQEIVIRSKDGKEMNLKVEISGDKITVNGKPLSEFKDDQITINKRKMTIRHGDRAMALDFNTVFDKNNFSYKFDGKGESKAFLGVTTEIVDEGAKVTDVVKGSAAEKAGIKTGDIITSVADKKITEDESLSDIVSSQKPKDQVKIAYLRNGKQNSAKATLGERKGSDNLAWAYGPKNQLRSFNMPAVPAMPGEPAIDFDGYGQNSLGALTPYMSFARQKKIGLKIQDTEDGGNVKVIDVEEGSAAEKAGLKKDDLITEISGKKITNTDEARLELNPAEAKPSYPVKALRNGAVMSFDIKIPKKLKTADL